MTALSEYVLKTLEGEYAFYRSQLQQTTMMGVYGAMLGLVSVYTTPLVFSRTTLQTFFDPNLHTIVNYAIIFYWIGLAIAWFFTLVLYFPVPEKMRFEDDFTLDNLVRKIEESERRRLPQTIPLANCPAEVQELVAEIVRIEVANKLAERIPLLRRRWHRRIALQAFVPYGISVCLAGYVVFVVYST